MGGLLENVTWKVGGIAASLLAAVLGVSLGICTVQKNALSAQVRTLQSDSERHIADLTTCRNNRSVLTGAIARSNADVLRIANEGAARIATARTQVEAARRETAIVQSRLDRALVTPIRGETPCARIEDVDQRILEMLR